MQVTQACTVRLLVSTGAGQKHLLDTGVPCVLSGPLISSHFSVVSVKLKSFYFILFFFYIESSLYDLRYD